MGAQNTAAQRYTPIEMPGQDDAYSWAISEAGVGLVKGLGGGPRRFQSEGHARAAIAQMIKSSLEAAAPDLLDALRELLRATDFDDREPWVVKAHAAIAKAEGSV